MGSTGPRAVRYGLSNGDASAGASMPSAPAAVFVVAVDRAALGDVAGKGVCMQAVVEAAKRVASS